MSDSLEPPAKRARLDGDADASIYGASLDAPGSPVDDMDDDFYDTTPVKPAALPVVDGSAPMYAAAAAAQGPASFQLPGLGGSMGETPATQPTPQSGAKADVQSPPEASEDGEVSDSEVFYHEQSAIVPAAGSEAQAPDASAQHGEISQPSLQTVSSNSVQDAAPIHVAAPGAGQGEAVADGEALAQEDSDGDDLALAITNGLAEEDGKAEFLQAAEANKNNKSAEWQLDSDASDSGSSSDSSSDDSSDEEGSDDGELLDPEEQVRLLMAESLDEPGATKTKVKTLNEVEEQYEKPDITVTPETKITELGKVESLVDNIVVVKGKVSGDLQVLESGSALCLQDRTVIGKISEQIGRVEEPRYALGFNDAAEITTLGIAKDTPIYYVDDHSTFVFTEPLRAQKHTDASNLHDEETNEVDFSDDEKEAEYKREQKAKKRARQDDEQEPAPVAKKIPTGPKGHVDVPNYYQPVEYQGGGLKYSDDEDEDLGMYKPLARPDHFEQIVGHGAPLEDRSHVRRGMMRGRGAWGDRGRGFRGRGGFGGRGDFGGGQADRGGHGGGRGDRGGHSGRGDQGNRGGAQGGRTDRTCYACGQVGHQKRECPTLKPQLDRGRQQNQSGQQQDNRQNNGPYQDQRSATSASPNRNQRGQSQQSSQPQHSPPAKSKNKNRKQRAREKKEKEREQQQQQQQAQQQQQQQQKQQQSQHHASPAPSAPAAPTNTNAYANNSAAGWPQQYSHSPQPAAAYAPPPPSAAAASYAPQMPYAQVAAPAPAPAAAPAQQQANWAAWAQWISVVQTMQQQQQQQQAAVAPPPPPQAQAQPQAQYPYQYQQYAQPPHPPANPHPQADPQSAQSLQDILRALGGGGQR